jgi:hypothetical protein
MKNYGITTLNIILLITCTLAPTSTFAKADARISIKIQKHQPCAVEEGAQPAQMEFANSDEAPLVVDDENPGG